MMSLCRSSARMRGTLLVGCIAAWGLLGCGADQYEFRLKQSKDYYNFLAHIEQNLAPKWADPNRIVDIIRVPKQFQPIPAPVPVKNENGEEVLPAVDPRQPDYMNLVFAPQTLVGAWEVPFSVAAKDGSTDSRKGYIYVLSNYWQFLGEDPADALKFIGNTVQLVGDALGDHIEPAKLESPDEELHPKKGRYLAETRYQVYNFHPKPITQPGPERESTVNYTFTMYAQTNANIQAIVLVVLPENIPAQEKLIERIPMMLEHFHITKTEPKAQSSSGGAAPASNPAGF